MLDVGCGPGDSSFAAAAVVGPEGEVLGIDRSHAAVARARSRAARAGLGHVRFANADLETSVLAGGFDAAIGRGVLVHLRRPAAALAQVAAAVEPGGIVAFQELVVSSATTTPRVPLYARVHRLLEATLSAAGLDPDLGRQLHGIFRDAGLPAPSLHLSAPVAHAADPRGPRRGRPHAAAACCRWRSASTSPRRSRCRSTRSPRASTATPSRRTRRSSCRRSVGGVDAAAGVEQYVALPASLDPLRIANVS